MSTFQYEHPKTLADAVQLLGRHGARARVLAGGSDLLIQMRSGKSDLAAVVDVKHVPELVDIAIGTDTVRLGAAVRCWDLGLRDDFRALFPGIVEAAELIGSMQIQGRATVGGNVCNASPAADTTPALIACGARCVIAGSSGTREVAVEDFIRGPGQNALAEGEILVGFDLPRPAERCRDAYLRFIPRGEMDIAVVGAGVQVTLDDKGRCSAARVVLGAVAPTAIRVPDAEAALIGSTLDDAALAAAAAASSAAATPISDKRGTVEYRCQVAGVLTKRSARIAADRAQGA